MLYEEAGKAFDMLGSPRVLVVGDVMLDRYSFCEVDRISPEAPIPVLDIRREETWAGGASNVAAKCVQLGAEALIAGVVGGDPEGAELKRLLASSGVDVSLVIEDPSRPTTLKHRFLARNQQVLRADRELREPLSPSVRDSLFPLLLDELERSSVLVVSDYAKGLLTPDMLAELIRKARSLSLPVVVDPKGRDYSRYRGADVLTPNTKEAFAAAGMDGEDDEDALHACARRILEITKSPYLVITRSEKGMTVFDSSGAHRDFPALKREVYDITGAGDAVAAAFAVSLGSGMDPFQAAPLATIAAGLTVAQLGVGKVTREELRAAVYGGLLNATGKILPRRRLVEVIESLRAGGARIVFTNGCFDLLHVGHIKMLERAKEYGDVLVVAINTDESVRRLKGPNRPIIDEEARAAVIASLLPVDFVTLFDEDTPLELIRLVRPDVLVKGGDYTTETVVGADFVLSYGGRVEVIPLVEGFSTTDIVGRVLDRYREGKDGR